MIAGTLFKVMNSVKRWRHYVFQRHFFMRSSAYFLREIVYILVLKLNTTSISNAFRVLPVVLRVLMPAQTQPGTACCEPEGDVKYGIQF